MGDRKVQFCLAQRDPLGAATTGILRVPTTNAAYGPSDSMKFASKGGSDAWPADQYLNIWVCNLNFANGYAYFPGVDPEYDGVVLHWGIVGSSGTPYPYHLGRTGTHEVGHWLGLWHTFQDGCSGTSPGDCAAGGDLICDTPPDNTPSYGCNLSENSCIESPIDMPDQLENYMDYSGDDCKSMYSKGQCSRMRGFLFTYRKGLLNSLGCTPVSGTWADAGLNYVNEPGLESCATTVAPSLNISNRSTFTLSSLTINYRLDGGAWIPYAWRGAIPAGSSANATLPTMTISPGNHTLEFASSAPNSFPDNYILNDTSRYAFTIIAAGDGISPIFSEEFEGAIFPPAGWLVENPGDDKYWEKGSVSDAGIGAGSALYENFYNSGFNTIDYLLTPVFDFSFVGLSFFLSFSRAYSLPHNTFYCDTLKIWSSTDCGQSWNLRWVKGGADLSTTPTPSKFSPFYPDSSQWVVDSIDVSSLASQPLIRFRFENRSRWSNNLFLDNINLRGSMITGMNELPSAELAIYPNPGTDKLYLSGNVLADAWLIDFNGKLLYCLSAENDISDLPAGMFLIHASTTYGLRTWKWVKVNP